MKILSYNKKHVTKSYLIQTKSNFEIFDQSLYNVPPDLPKYYSKISTSYAFYMTNCSAQVLQNWITVNPPGKR
jgi:hypothetical protein